MFPGRLRWASARLVVAAAVAAGDLLAYFHRQWHCGSKHLHMPLPMDFVGAVESVPLLVDFVVVVAAGSFVAILVVAEAAAGIVAAATVDIAVAEAPSPAGIAAAAAAAEHIVCMLLDSDFVDRSAAAAAAT